MEPTLANKLIEANKEKSEHYYRKSLSSANFYEGQARLDGAIEPSFNKTQRDAYLQQIHAAGVRAIDMNLHVFAFCKTWIFQLPQFCQLSSTD